MSKVSLFVAFSMMMFACVDDQVDSTDVDESYVVQPIPPHTGPGVIACWRSNAPNATCTLPQLCRYTPSYLNTATCVPPQSQTSGHSWISIDGPEDCAVGQRACFSGINYPWGQRYKTRCQVEACGPAEPDLGGTVSILDDGLPIDYGTLCNEATGCPDGLSCVIAGTQPPPPSYPWDLNHGGLLRPIRLCR